MPLEHEISECADPAEIAKKVKLAFKKMPGEKALFIRTMESVMSLGKVLI